MSWMPQVQTAYIQMKGGEDLITPAVSVEPGTLTLSLNYEAAITEGYRRIDGYERFDGRPKPSEATYWRIPFTGGLGIAEGDPVYYRGPQVDELVEGDTSGASGIVLAVQVRSGSWAAQDAQGDLILYGVTGEFAPDEGMSVGLDTFATAGQDIMQGSSPTDEEDLEWALLSIEKTRAVIEPLPGSGPVRGVHVFNGVPYAWRDNAAATQCVMYKATAAGWVAIDLDASALPAGGRYELISHNFYATTGGWRMFGVNGVGRAFMWDGTTITYLDTGMLVADDKPTHIAAHRDHLFLGYPQGVVMHSGIGDPENWDAATGGAGEVGVSAGVTGFASLPGDLLAIFSHDRVNLLYGTSAADWRLDLYSDDAGAVEWTIQRLGEPRFLAGNGLTSLSVTNAYGDFVASSFSNGIHPLLSAMRDKVVASIRVTKKDQYRLFFSDGTGIIAKFRGSKPEFTRINYTRPVLTCCNGDDALGNEILLFGSNDGYVYEMDAGTSFDGEAVEALARLPFGHLRTPQHTKRFRKILLEMDAPRGTEIEFTQEYNYGSSLVPRGITQDLRVLSGGGYWGGAVWGQFTWGGEVVGTAVGYLSGSGINISVLLRSVSSHVPPHTIHGMFIHYSLRGRQR